MAASATSLAITAPMAPHTAVFSGVRTDYSITLNPDGTLRVVDNRGIDSTAAGDTLKDVEFLQFSNGTFAVGSLINFAATGAPVISDLTPTEGQALTVNTASIADANGLGAFSYQWQALVGATWTNIAGATGASFTPDDNPGTSFGDQAGLAAPSGCELHRSGGQSRNGHVRAHRSGGRKLGRSSVPPSME